MSARKFVVITSINPPSKAVEAFAAWPGWETVVVGDRKTPDELWAGAGVTYLSMDRQAALFPELSVAVPDNAYARKILGYAYAIRHGARFIFDTDDDNVPHRGAAEVVERVILAEDWTAGRRVRTRAGWFNTFSAFGNGGTWPRGFPLHLVHDVDTRPGEGRGCEPWGVVQFMVDSDPDFDAIGRMMRPGGAWFDSVDARRLVMPDRGTFAPINSQATLWPLESFPMLYLPVGIADRVTDIMRGYVAQAGLWRSGCVAAFAGALVLQERNPHDPARDMVDEIPLYVNAADWCRRLAQAGGDNPVSCYRAALRTLAECGAVPKANLDTYGLFLQAAGLGGAV